MMSPPLRTAGSPPGGTGLGAMPVPSAASVALPLPYLVTGIGAAGLFGLLLPWVAPDALLSPQMPHILALTHIVTLGWLTMIVLGASMQLVPVMTVGPLRAARFARWQFPAYVAGVALLVTGFWFTITPLVIAGGTLVVLAVLHHAVMILTTIARAATRPLSTLFMAAAMLYLLAVVALGLTMALDLRFNFLGAAGQRVLVTHLTLGIVGWLTNMLIGVSYTLVRMFALVHGHGDRAGRVCFGLVQGGVLALAWGDTLGWSWLQWLGGLALVGAVWLFAWDDARMLRMRRRKPLDATLRHGIAAVGFLTLVAPLALAAVLRGDAAPGQQVALVLLLLVGWLGQSTVGYLYKIIPFLVWQSRFSPLLGRQKVPLMRDMIRQRWAALSLWLINIGVIATAGGFCFGWSWPLRLAACVLGAGLLLAAANIIAAATMRPQSG